MVLSSRVSTPIEPGDRLPFLPQRDRIGVEPSWFGCMQQPGRQPGMQGKRANADHALAPCSREIQLRKHRTLEYCGHCCRYTPVRRKRANFVKAIFLRIISIGTSEMLVLGGFQTAQYRSIAWCGFGNAAKILRSSHSISVWGYRLSWKPRSPTIGSSVDRLAPPCFQQVSGIGDDSPTERSSAAVANALPSIALGPPRGSLVGRISSSLSFANESTSFHKGGRAIQSERRDRRRNGATTP